MYSTRTIRFAVPAIAASLLLAAASTSLAHHASHQAPSQGIGYVPSGVKTPDVPAGQAVSDTTVTRPEVSGGQPRDARSAPTPAHPR